MNGKIVEVRRLDGGKGYWIKFSDERSVGYILHHPSKVDELVGLVRTVPPVSEIFMPFESTEDLDSFLPEDRGGIQFMGFDEESLEALGAAEETRAFGTEDAAEWERTSGDPVMRMLFFGGGARALASGLSEADVGRVFYVTDIHLDAKIAKRFPGGPTRGQLESFVGSVVHRIRREMAEGLEAPARLDGRPRGVLLVGGDVSCRFSVVRMFYSMLSDAIRGYRIVAVLGNHELWALDVDYAGEHRLEHLNMIYRDMCEDLGVTLLQNELLVLENGVATCVGADALLGMSDESIQRIVSCGSLPILGGTGFTGLDGESNATDGIYMSTITSLERDAEQSRMFEAIHRRIASAVPDLPVIVLTHTPVGDWTRDGCAPGWFYVNGHTHHNSFREENGAKVLSDNQTGYDGEVHLKMVPLSGQTDVLGGCADGTSVIPLWKYQRFCRQKGFDVEMNRKGEIVMLKRDGWHMFFLRDPDTGDIRLLKGGQILRTGGRGLEYFYDNMVRYGEAVSGIMGPYGARIGEVSRMVRSIGGSGRIHGCIVDVDCWNHVYLNPLDGTVTPYHALDTRRKSVYRSFAGMLKSEREDLYSKFKALVKTSGEAEDRLGGTEEGATPYDGTEIYRVSRRILEFQRIAERRIIRVWDDSVLLKGEIRPADATGAVAGRASLPGAGREGPDGGSGPAARSDKSEAGVVCTTRTA